MVANDLANPEFMSPSKAAQFALSCYGRERGGVREGETERERERETDGHSEIKYSIIKSLYSS